LLILIINSFAARRYTSVVYAVVMCLSVCPSVCLSQASIVLKRLNIGWRQLCHTIAQRLVFCRQSISAKLRCGHSTGALNTGGLG